MYNYTIKYICHFNSLPLLLKFKNIIKFLGFLNYLDHIIYINNIFKLNI